jgi:hypothetical protein
MRFFYFGTLIFGFLASLFAWLAYSEKIAIEKAKKYNKDNAVAITENKKTADPKEYENNFFLLEGLSYGSAALMGMCLINFLETKFRR